MVLFRKISRILFFRLTLKLTNGDRETDQCSKKYLNGTTKTEVTMRLGHT